MTRHEKLLVGTWNVNAWTINNSQLRSETIELMNFDIICITETHLPGDSNITMSNYTWFGHNRTLTHSRARRASGGVGWLIKNDLLNDYSFNVIDKSFEGIIAMECKHIATNFTMVLIGAYLPPENTNWGRESTQFFTHLIMLSYRGVAWIFELIRRILIVCD